MQKVSFTGGPSTARKILATCAEFLKPAVLELGGKSANIVFPDADLDMAVAVNAFSVLGTLAGQGCAIASRMLVHSDIYDAVVERVLAMVDGMRCGDPFDPATVISPVVTRQAQERILAMIERAQSRRGEALGRRSRSQPPAKRLLRRTDRARRRRPGLRTRPGRSVRPGALADPLRHRRAGDRHRELDRIRARLVRLHEGHRPDTAHGDAHCKAGGVYINGASPVVGCELAFGGVGISGYGREGGEEGLFEFLRTKAVGIA